MVYKSDIREARLHCVGADMIDLVDRLKPKNLTDEQLSAYLALLRMLKVYQTVDATNAVVNGMVKKLEEWV